jgi:hypothetical protein
MREPCYFLDFSGDNDLISFLHLPSTARLLNQALDGGSAIVGSP